MYGYARVSTQDQNLDRQLRALSDFGVDPHRVFTDKASGVDYDRPAYKQLMGRMREGDTLVVKSIDRLGRNYDETLEEWRRITRTLGAAIVVVDMPLLDTREKPDGLAGVLISDIVLQLLSYVAQVEHENIRQRQAEGIAAARARGVSFGRPRKKRPENYGEVRDIYRSRAITRPEAASRLNVSESTFARWLREDAGR